MKHTKLSEDQMTQVKDLLSKVANGELVPVDSVTTKEASDESMKTAAAETAKSLCESRAISAANESATAENLSTHQGALDFAKRAGAVIDDIRQKHAAEIQALKERVEAAEGKPLVLGESVKEAATDEKESSTLKTAKDNFARRLGVAI